MANIPKEAAVVSTTGLISRYLFETFDSERNFYSPGAMGLASSIALGLAVNSPSRTVVVIDGDGSLLMNLGALVTVGAHKPSNLLHVVLDNAAYGSCSEEPTLSISADLAGIARTVGYRTVAKFSNSPELEQGLKSAIGAGPAFIHVMVALGGPRNHARPSDLATLTYRFRKFMAGTTVGLISSF